MTVISATTSEIFDSKITPGGTITRIIGTGGDGAGNTLDFPVGIATDVSGNVFVTGSGSNNVFKITAGSATATEEADSGIPTWYALHGNYPNPFNPTTTIQIELPETAVVKLAVYDVLGHVVLRLESGRVPAGRHRYVVDASMLPSGVYLYRLETKAFSQSRRMMLLK